MRRSWPVLLIGFNLLLLLMFGSSLAATKKSEEIYGEILRNQESFRQNDRILEEMRAGMYLVSLLVRDFLVDNSALAAVEYKRDLLAIKASIEDQAEELHELTRSEDTENFKELEREIDSYWATLDPIFQWTPQEKVERSWRFLRKELRGRRTAVVSIAQDISKLNTGAILKQNDAFRASKASLDAELRNVMIATLIVGVLIASGTVFRVWHLERRTVMQHRKTEEAERTMRDLSHQLVHAQEEERKTLSRELHDEVGQLLTALRMELQNIEKLNGSDDAAFRQHLEEGKQLSARSLAIVRDLAMGLRPSMLDDLGLAPAIEWQARDFTRRTGIKATAQIEGNFDSIPESHRTCLYRIVQEALTNCARHSQAQSIRISLYGAWEGLRLTVQDDGVGMDEKRRCGLGLVGIGERVRELNGFFDLFSQPGSGTVLSVEIPLMREVAV